MPFESRETQAGGILDRLYEEYLDTTISLSYSSHLELLIAAMLLTQCTDERVSRVTTELSEKYDDAAGYAATGREELADGISSTIYYNNRAKYIRSACTDIIEEHDGEVPGTMSALIDLAGVGRKTVNVVLQHDYDTVEGIVVNTHVRRLSRRLDLTEGEYPGRVEKGLMPVVPKRDWQQFTHLFISHEKAVCGMRNPDCGTCALEDLCPSSKHDHDVDLVSDEAR